MNIRMPNLSSLVGTLDALGVAKGLSWAVLAVALSACSVLPKAEPVVVYRLPPLAPAAQSSEVARLPFSLRLSRPLASVSLEGKGLLVVPASASNQLSVYKGVRWSDATPALLRARLLDAFRVDGRIAALSTDEARLHADYELSSDLLAFQAEYVGATDVEAVLALNLRLVRRQGRQIVATHTFTVRQRAASPAIDDVVQAFGEGSERLGADVVDWAVSYLQRVQ